MADLHWQEPSAYRRHREGAFQGNWVKRQAALAIVVFTLMMGIGFVARINPSATAHPPSIPVLILLCLVFALFAAFGLPALTLLLPSSTVIVSEKGINLNAMSGGRWFIRFWPWDRIAKLTIAQATVNGKSFRTLSLTDHSAAELITLGIPDKVTDSQIDATIRQFGRSLNKLN